MPLVYPRVAVGAIGAILKSSEGRFDFWVDHPIATSSASQYHSPMSHSVHHLPMRSRAITAAKQSSPLIAICGSFALFLSGCDTAPDSHLVSAPPPHAPVTTVMTTTTTTSPVVVASPGIVVANSGYVTASSTVPVVSTMIVTQAPPALQQEAVLAQPGPGYVWLAGFWTWRNERYEWMAGHWQLPPSSTSVWVAPRWEQEGNAYRFYEGTWN